MTRLHRSVRKRVSKIDPDRIANKAEDYIEAYGDYKKFLDDARGLTSVTRLRTLIKKIDTIEREMIKNEEKMERLAEKRALQAVKLEDELRYNLAVVKDYLHPDEYKDFV
jgi:hypothetical protein